VYGQWATNVTMQLVRCGLRLRVLRLLEVIEIVVVVVGFLYLFGFVI
jgi:hypothetical protein